ncbi:MAG: PorV/PorQ family protein [Candidatus Cloacimonetes bacterium]|nr:PorV/PorQ family protein [Candidatus Cloacimonadota bacterium]
MRKYRFVVLVILIFGSALLHAEYQGETGFQMLQIPSGAAQAGMAGTGFMYADNAFSIWDNAAAGLMNSNRTISANQNFWIYDTSLSSVAYSNHMGNMHIGIGAKYLDYGKIENRDYTGLYLGEYHPWDMQMTMNWGMRLEASHYIGVNVSYIYEKIDTASSYGGTVDIGYIYKTPLRGTNTYLTVKHLGATSKVEEESIDLPMTVEAGITNLVELEQIVFTTDLRATNEFSNDFRAAFGVESSYAGLFFLRAGYSFNYDKEDFSFGAGIKLEKMGIDYAFIPDKTELGSINMVSVSYKF